MKIGPEAYRALVDHLPVGVVCHGPAGGIVLANATARQILGLSEDSILGRTAKDPRWRAVRENGEDFPGEEHPAMVVRRTGKSVSGEIMGVFNPVLGDYRWISIDAFLVGAGETLVCTTFTDITERRAAAREIASLARFPGENPNPVMRFQNDGAMVYANKASSHLLAELGLGVGLEVTGPLREACAEAIKAKGCHSFNQLAGPKTYYLTVCHVADGDYFNVYGMDVTSLKDIQRALKKERDFIDAVVRNAASLVVVLDTAGRIERFNRACESNTGYAFEEVKGRVFWDFLLAPEEIEPVKQAFARLAAGDSLCTIENHWVSRDGAKRLISWNITAIQDAGGKMEFAIKVGTDITREREQDRQRQREMRSLEGMGAPLVASVTADSLGVKSLSQGLPDVFERLVGDYQLLLDQAVEMLAVAAGHSVSRGLEEMCETLGRLRAGPRDATEIHIAALKGRTTGASAEKSLAYHGEGRILLIELLGKMSLYYRNHCLGAPETGHG